MIQLRHQERSLWEGLFAEEVAELWEPWLVVQYAQRGAATLGEAAQVQAGAQVANRM